jgi:hypothetical protein
MPPPPARPTRPITRAPVRACDAPPLPLTDRPHPSVALFPSRHSPADNPGPPVSPFVPAREFTDAIPVDHLPPRILAITPARVKLGTALPPQLTVLAACPRGLVPSAVRPHRRCGIPRRRQLAFGRFPARDPIKRTARAPSFLTPASATPSPLP